MVYCASPYNNQRYIIVIHSMILMRIIWPQLVRIIFYHCRNYRTVKRKKHLTSIVATIATFLLKLKVMLIMIIMVMSIHVNITKPLMLKSFPKHRWPSSQEESYWIKPLFVVVTTTMIVGRIPMIHVLIRTKRYYHHHQLVYPLILRRIRPQPRLSNHSMSHRVRLLPSWSIMLSPPRNYVAWRRHRYPRHCPIPVPPHPVNTIMIPRTRIVAFVVGDCIPPIRNYVNNLHRFRPCLRCTTIPVQLHHVTLNPMWLSIIWIIFPWMYWFERLV